MLLFVKCNNFQKKKRHLHYKTKSAFSSNIWKLLKVKEAGLRGLNVYRITAET